MNKQIYKSTNLQTPKGFTPNTKKLVWGFTLVEVLIYIGLMGVFLLVLLDIFTATLNTKLSSESTSALNMDSRYILAKLKYDINNADSIISPAEGASGSSLQLITGGVTATYASNSGNFTKTETSTLNLNGWDTALTALSFKSVGVPGGKPTVQISYTLRSKITANTGNATQTINTTIGTR
jgi:Tfp pilus assembly protein PilV